MSTCTQCGRPPMWRVGNHLLCLDCYTKLQQVEALQQQARNQYLDRLSAHQNYLMDMMGWSIGLNPTPPRRQIPQQIKAQIDNRTFNTMNISNSQIGMLNAGSIQNVKRIDINLSYLAQHGQEEVANALARFTEAVSSDNEIHQQDRAELLEQIEVLSSQAALQPEERKTGLIKPVLNSFCSTIGVLNNLSKMWSTFGDTICNYFGVENPLK